MSQLIEMVTDDGDIILDSFAGSGSTAHAVLSLNKHGSNRKFVLIEMLDYAETKTAERVKKVISGYTAGKAQIEPLGGDFSFYELGERLLNTEGKINENLDVQEIYKYIWYMETKGKIDESVKGCYLGKNNGIAYYFNYNKNEVTTLDKSFLSTISVKAEEYVIYADKCALSPKQLSDYRITFKKIPRDIARL